MAEGIYKITEQFEAALSAYTGAPYVVAVDSCSSALFLCLTYWRYNKGETITIPERTYMSVPCEIIHAGLKVNFAPVDGKLLKGEYQLAPTNIWDSALRFTSGMYVPGRMQCLSFTGPLKHLKLSKGGAILTDDAAAAAWFKRARFSGRRECSYHNEQIDCIGWNMYLLPELATRGLMLLTEFPKHNEDLALHYPNLSNFKIYKQ